MASKDKPTEQEINQLWTIYLTEGRVPSFVSMPWYRAKSLNSLYRRLPSSPRCRMCLYPFGGFGGAVVRHLCGIRPSRLNPQMCNDCEQFAQKYKGGAEVEVTVFMCDVRGSTQMAEKMKPAEYSHLIGRFYNAATQALFETGAMVEKLVGDAVTGFYTSGQSGPDHAARAVHAARETLRLTGHHQPSGPWIPVGVGVHTGLAYVGAIDNDSGVTDIVVLGDTANIAARLVALAGAGQIYISEATARAAGLNPSGAQLRQENLKGRSEPVDVWVLGS